MSNQQLKMKRGVILNNIEVWKTDIMQARRVFCFGSVDSPVSSVMIALPRTFSGVNCLTLPWAVGLHHVR